MRNYFCTNKKNKFRIFIANRFSFSTKIFSSFLSLKTTFLILSKISNFFYKFTLIIFLFSNTLSPSFQFSFPFCFILILLFPTTLLIFLLPLLPLPPPPPLLPPLPLPPLPPLPLLLLLLLLL